MLIVATQEPGTVHHAADFTVQSDVVQVDTWTLELFGVFFGGVAEAAISPWRYICVAVQN